MIALVIVVAICDPGALQGQVSLASLARNLLTLAMVGVAITVIRKRQRDRHLGE